MAIQEQPLIIGAGPVGLAAALFLARQGRKVRIVEMLAEPAKESRALAVNPRTLEILEPTGLTRQMLELGSPIRGVTFHREEKVVATLKLEGIHPKYPFMLALSQASTERLLVRALERAGVGVERSTKLVNCVGSSDQVAVVLEPTPGGTRKLVDGPWLLAADGAHSTVRETLHVGFPGSSLDDDWYLADLPLRTALPADHGQVFFFEGGALSFMIRVVDEVFRDQPGEPLWRVISNRPDPLSHLVQAEQAGAPVWESKFHVAHRIVERMAEDNVYFAGDAAHVHSPLGARGMNLGIEDAWVFSELVRSNRLAQYDELRREVDRRVVRRVELLTRLAAAETPFPRIMRNVAFPAAIKTPVLRGRMLAAVTGLDHQLPDLSEWRH